MDSVKYIKPDNCASQCKIYDICGDEIKHSEIIGYIMDGAIYDTHAVITEDAMNIHLLTADDAHSRMIINHSLAHIMAFAVQTLYPEAKLGYSKESDTGFYYDFHELNAKIDDSQITNLMKKIIKQHKKMLYRSVSILDAMQIFQHEPIKIHKIQQLHEEGHEFVSVYSISDKWHDLCAGPHIDDLKKAGQYFSVYECMNVQYDGKKVLRIKGASWKNSSQKDTFYSQLKNKNRHDHQTIGHDMSIFHTSDNAVGEIFWHPNGVHIVRALERIVKANRYDVFQEIITPMVMSEELWKLSGHFEAYYNNMFRVEPYRNHDKNDNQSHHCSALRPMNCIGATQVFNASHFSYKDLPVRLSENGLVYRNEPSGALRGLSRSISFTIDDAHIFCTREQISNEVHQAIKSISTIYQSFGFDVLIYLATKPDNAIGDDDLWTDMINGLKDALGDIPYVILDGEGAFYGPKIEFHVRDNSGRSWQCGTVQLDFNMPIRLNVQYNGSDNALHHPIMIHMASLGSYSRFISVLLEHYNGALPCNVNPIQIAIITVSEAHIEYAKKIYHKLWKGNVRVVIDTNSTTLGYKIKKFNKKRAYCVGIIGDDEIDSNTISIRRLFGDNAVHKIKIDDIFAFLGV